MKISELHPGQSNVSIELTIISLDIIKEIDKYGKKLKLLNTLATDGDNEIKLTLWNENTEKIKPGLVIKITNGYVSEFKGEKQITLGREGKLEII